MKHPIRFGVACAVPALLVTLAGCTAAPAPETSDIEVNAELRELLPAEYQESGTIIVGGMYDNPPLLSASLSNPNLPEGIAYDLSAEVGALLGVEFTWRNTQFPALIPGIESGTLDVMWTLAATTTDREQNVLDMIGYYQSTFGMLVPAGNPKGIEHLADLCGATVGVNVGSIQTTWLQQVNEQYCVAEGAADITVTEYQGSEDTALRSGAIDATLDSLTVLQLLSEENPDVFEAVAIPTEESESFDPGIVAIGISKTNPGLSEAIAAALQELHENGRYQEIFDSYEVDANFPEADVVVINPLTGTPAGEVVGS